VAGTRPAPLGGRHLAHDGSASSGHFVADSPRASLPAAGYSSSDVTDGVPVGDAAGRQVR